MKTVEAIRWCVPSREEGNEELAARGSDIRYLAATESTDLGATRRIPIVNLDVIVSTTFTLKRNCTQVLKIGINILFVGRVYKGVLFCLI